MTPTTSRISLCLLAALLAGCATCRLAIPAYPLHSPAAAPGHFIAGAARAEITPPAGFPLGGHGPGGRVARGYWTRLYARAFSFEDAQGRRLVLASADLFAIPAGLHAKVAALVNRRYRLQPEEFILAATHTHHGPSNYASSEIYNSFAGPLPHFDPVLLDFLAARIADAVARAIADAQSHAASGHQLRVYAGAAPGIQRNRAIAPFFANPDPLRTAILAQSEALGATCPDGATHGCPRYLAADPTLQLLEIIRDGAPRALLVFYAVHPTAVSHDADLYSSDLAGIACAALERDRAPVAGFFNGAEGDVSPDWTAQDRDDAIRLGTRLAQAAAGLLDRGPAHTDPDPAIAVARKTVSNHWRDADGTGFASKPMAGAAEPGGAEDGRTLFYTYGFRAESRQNGPSGEQGPKVPALDGPLPAMLASLDANSLSRIVKTVDPGRLLSSRIFPESVPVTWVKLGSFGIAALPVEATTAVGFAARRATGASALIGLANEYLGYTATAAEYRLQQYEGASTLLGPGEAAGLTRLLTLAASGHGDPPSGAFVPRQVFRPGPRRRNIFGPETLLIRRRRNMIDEDLEPLLPRRLQRQEPRIPRLEWTESAAGDWRADARQVAVEVREGDAWREADTDRGLNILTVLAEATPGYRRYSALWIPPAGASGLYRFHIRTPAGIGICSRAFTLATPPDTIPVPPVPPAECQ